MTHILTITALCMLPIDGATEDRVDALEVNHVYDACGNKVFTQLIFWDWCAADCRMNVVAWRLVKDDSPGIRPQRRHHLGDWQSTWHDGDTLRRVTAGAFRETWTQYDPELNAREILPKEKRRGLTNEKNNRWLRSVLVRPRGEVPSP